MDPETFVAACQEHACDPKALDETAIRAAVCSDLEVYTVSCESLGYAPTAINFCELCGNVHRLCVGTTTHTGSYPPAANPSPSPSPLSPTDALQPGMCRTWDAGNVVTFDGANLVRQGGCDFGRAH